VLEKGQGGGIWTGPRFEYFDNGDGTKTHHFETKTKMELLVHEGLSAALTGFPYHQAKRKFVKFNLSFDECKRQLNSALDPPFIADSQTLKNRIMFNAKQYLEDVKNKEGVLAYKRYSVSLQQNNGGQNHVSFVLCGGEKGCELFVTANTEVDKTRWENDNFKASEMLGLQDPRRPYKSQK
jgi:hypothetical protein